jgi:2-(1,2-epoxy-1,2-dihydrophenyl)acetyl-CoA isomerase
MDKDSSAQVAAYVRLFCSDGIAEITLARREAHNAIDLNLAQQLAGAAERVGEAARTDQVRVLILRAEGPSFCVGGDLRALAATTDPAIYLDDLVGTAHRGVEMLYALPIPIIAVVDGACAGAGLGLALLADITLATSAAQFRVAYTAVGLSPDCGVSRLLPARIGLVTELVEPDALAATTREFAVSIAALPSHAVTATRRLIRTSDPEDFSRHLATERRTITALVQERPAQQLISAASASRHSQA